MMDGKLIFCEEGHVYKRGDVLVPSVSAVLRKAYPSSFSFAKVDRELLALCADYGTMVHNEIENWLVNGVNPDAAWLEFQNFADWWISEGLEFIDSEQIVDGGWYGGKYDIKARYSDGRTVLLDLKTTSSVSRPKWSKQLTMYNFVERCDEIMVVWLHNEKFRVVPIEYIGDEFVEETRRLYLSN